MEAGDVTELLKLYRRSGELLWSGHNGVTAMDDGSLLAEFRDLRWTDSALQTLAVPYDKAPPFALTLKLRVNGKWSWAPLPARINGIPVAESSK